MKTVLLWLCLALAVNAQTNAVVEILSFTTTKGKLYEDVKVSRVTDKGLVLLYPKGGGGTVPFEELPDWLAKRFNPRNVNQTQSHTLQGTNQISEWFPSTIGKIYITMNRDVVDGFVHHFVGVIVEDDLLPGFSNRALAFTVDGKKYSVNPVEVDPDGVGKKETGLYTAGLGFLQLLGKSKVVECEVQGYTTSASVNLSSWEALGVYANYCTTNRINLPAGVVAGSAAINVAQATAASWKVTEKNNTWWRFAYQFTGGGQIGKYVTVQFLDASGFVVDDQLHKMVGGKETGYTLINLPGAGTVRTIRVMAR